MRTDYFRWIRVGLGYTMLQYDLIIKFLKKKKCPIHIDVYTSMLNYVRAYETFMGLGVWNCSKDELDGKDAIIDAQKKRLRNYTFDRHTVFFKKKLGNKIQEIILASQVFPDFFYVSQNFSPMDVLARWALNDLLDKKILLQQNPQNWYSTVKEFLYAHKFNLYTTNIFAPKGLLYLDSMYKLLTNDTESNPSNCIHLWNKNALVFNNCLFFFDDPDLEDITEMNTRQAIEYTSEVVAMDTPQMTNSRENQQTMLVERLYVVTCRKPTEHRKQIFIQNILETWQHIPFFRNFTVCVNRADLKRTKSAQIQPGFVIRPSNCVTFSRIAGKLVSVRHKLECKDQNFLVKTMMRTRTAFIVLIQVDPQYISRKRILALLQDHRIIPTNTVHTRFFVKNDLTFDQIQSQYVIEKNKTNANAPPPETVAFTFIVEYRGNIDIFHTHQLYSPAHRPKVHMPMPLLQGKEAQLLIEDMSALNNIYDTTWFLTPTTPIDIDRISPFMYNISPAQTEDPNVAQEPSLPVVLITNNPIWFYGNYETETSDNTIATCTLADFTQMLHNLNFIKLTLVPTEIHAIYQNQRIVLQQYNCQCSVTYFNYTPWIRVATFISASPMVLGGDFISGGMLEMIIKDQMTNDNKFLLDGLMQYINLFSNKPIK